MDRGEIHTHLSGLAADTQVCRYDLGDPGPPCLFLTACYPLGRPMYSDRTDTEVPDSPVQYGAPNGDWPQFCTVQELDALIAALQAQRPWLAEEDPAKRKGL